MPYISLKEVSSDEPKALADNRLGRAESQARKIFRHPVRNRILNILRDGVPRTQKEIGTLLSMSNAAVHYHIKILENIEIIKLHGTRLGPNGIVEKLYTVAVEDWPDVSEDDLEYYLDYMVSWMNERHREGVNILKSDRYGSPMIVGSYSARAPMGKLLEFKRRLERLVNDFYEQCGEENTREKLSFAVTFSILPSLETWEEDTRNVIEFEPDAEIEAAADG